MFDTPSSISNGEPIAGEDGDFMYGSGFFPLRAGQTEYFSIALVYGDDKDDLVRNKKTVQNIYDNDYRFAKAPPKNQHFGQFQAIMRLHYIGISSLIFKA